jgi:hypothetical protein
MNKVVLNVITEFKGLQNIKKAESAFDSLSRTVTRFAGAYTVERLVRSSLQAFMEQEKVLAGYSNSLKNLGVSYQDIAPVIDKTTQKFIDLGFQDNQTIEGLTKLTTALGNPAKALDALSIAADLARYKNMSISETSTLVAKAVAGNSRAFADLGLKIDKTLTPMNAFDKLLSQAKQKAGGAAEAYSKTLAGSLDIAAAKAENASEKLGGALAPSVQKLADAALKYLVPVFGILADNITPLLALASALAAVAFAMKAVGGASAIMSGELALNPLFAGAAGATATYFGIKGLIAGLKTVPTKIKNSALSLVGMQMGIPTGTITPAKTKEDDVKKLTAAEKYLLKLEKDWAAQSAKFAKEQKIADDAKIKAAKEKVALEKARLTLSMAGKVVDIDQAQIAAALMNNISDDIRDRLLLQRALLNDNADEAAKLAQKVISAQIQAIALAAINPVEGWTTSIADVIQSLIDLQKELANVSNVNLTPSQLLAGDYASVILDMQDTSWLSTQLETDAALALLDSLSNLPTLDGLLPNQKNPVIINNNFMGSVLTESGLSSTLANQNASGINSNLVRTNPFGAGFSS